MYEFSTSSGLHSGFILKHFLSAAEWKKTERRTSGGCGRLMWTPPQDTNPFCNIPDNEICLRPSGVFSDALIEFKYKNWRCKHLQISSLIRFPPHGFSWDYAGLGDCPESQDSALSSSSRAPRGACGYLFGLYLGKNAPLTTSEEKQHSPPPTPSHPIPFQ